LPFARTLKVGRFPTGLQVTLLLKVLAAAGGGGGGGAALGLEELSFLLS
jgi:hypothetical protein